MNSENLTSTLVCPPIDTITINNQCSLTEIGIFASSIILSLSAFITSVLGQIQKSKCKKIDCLGSSCVREV